MRRVFTEHALEAASQQSFAATCRVLLSASLYKGLSMQLQKAMVLMTLEVRLPS